VSEEEGLTNQVERIDHKHRYDDQLSRNRRTGIMVGTPPPRGCTPRGSSRHSIPPSFDGSGRVILHLLRSAVLPSREGENARRSLEDADEHRNGVRQRTQNLRLHDSPPRSLETTAFVLAVRRVLNPTQAASASASVYCS